MVKGARGFKFRTMNTPTPAPQWWRESVIYQIYPRSFFDSNADGEGDIQGITSHLDYVKELGVDAIWLSPFYTSPNKDGGYDVANPRDVDPRFGNLRDAQEMFSRAHALSLKVLVDVVPNHFSDQHPWFQEAIAAPVGSRARARFHFYDAKADGSPPNNWCSLFGGPAWTLVAGPAGAQQYYLHLFDSSQPDLNWDNQDVHADFEETLHFWLDLGADGFRIDVAHGLVKENIRSDHHDPVGLSNALRLDLEMDPKERNELLASVPFFNRPGVHEIYRTWRKLFDSYHRDVMAVAEAWVHPPIEATKFVRADELHQVFNFDLLIAKFESKELFNCINNTLEMLALVNAPPTWALSNHDSPRIASRIGVEPGRALALFVLALPGSCYIYNGQELGLPDAELADSDRADPAFIRSNGLQKGRDGARVPMPWSGIAPPFGFTTGKPWLPLPSTWSEFTVESEQVNELSSLRLYKAALALRRQYLVGSDDFAWISAGTDCILSFSRGGCAVILNTSTQAREIKISGELLISSSKGVTFVENLLHLTGASAAWIKLI